MRPTPRNANRLALATLAAALAVTVATPFGAGATRTVIVAFARNAGTVDHIAASRKPRPGQLLALDKHGKLPASVGAVGPRGAPGAAGPIGRGGPAGATGAAGPTGRVGQTGPRGAAGPSDAYVAPILHSPVDLATRQTVFAVSVPAGSYSIATSIALGDFDATHGHDATVDCNISVGGVTTSDDILAAMTDASAIPSYADITFTQGTTVTAAAVIAVKCVHISGTSTNVKAYGGGLTVTRTGTLH